MKLWLLEQDAIVGYDTYDSMVVAAETAEEAKQIHPDDFEFERAEWGRSYCGWATSPEQVTCTYLGVADASVKAGAVLKSFNAG